MHHESLDLDPYLDELLPCPPKEQAVRYLYPEQDEMDEPEALEQAKRLRQLYVSVLKNTPEFNEALSWDFFESDYNVNTESTANNKVAKVMMGDSEYFIKRNLKRTGNELVLLKVSKFNDTDLGDVEIYEEVSLGVTKGLKGARDRGSINYSKKLFAGLKNQPKIEEYDTFQAVAHAEQFIANFVAGK